MRTPVLLSCIAALALTACGGGSSSGGGSSLPNPGGAGTTPQAQSEDAITVTDSLGSPVKDLTNFNGNVSGVFAVGKAGQLLPMTGNGTCNNGVEFWAPDKNGDPNSTEEQYFYDSACAQIARDVVRIYNISGSSETLNRTEKQYAINNATSTAQRTTTVSFLNGTYDAHGFPIAADGFNRSATSELDIAGSKTLLDDNELVMMPSSTSVNAFCSDAAGYNATGFAALNETFGNQGGSSNGSRTINNDGSVTWQSTNTGTAYKGAIGSFGINIGAPNTSCPIATPEYSLQGGTAVGTYSIPVTVTFDHGLLTNLTVTSATLANGNTLDVTTNSGVSPQNNQFITGIISNSGTQLATFAINTFGDGTLTVTKTGAQFVINDWHVVR
jgi:hypothetical protein